MRSDRGNAIPTVVAADDSLPPAATTSTYETPCPPERTAAGQDGLFHPVAAESMGEAVMEIRRRSGLTWEVLSDLFNVSRRSVHHWANGKPVAAARERILRKMLAAIRHIDQGNQADTRAVLLAINPSKGASTFDLSRTAVSTKPWAKPGATKRPSIIAFPFRVRLKMRDARRSQHFFWRHCRIRPKFERRPALPEQFAPPTRADRPRRQGNGRKALHPPIRQVAPRGRATPLGPGHDRGDQMTERAIIRAGQRQRNAAPA